LNSRIRKFFKWTLLRTSPTFKKVQRLENMLREQKIVTRQKDMKIDLLYKYILDVNHGLRLTIDNLDDYISICGRYHEVFGTYPDLCDPRKFSEKIQWRKLFDRKSIYTLCADKYRVREYVSERIGEEHLIPVLQVCGQPEQIDYSALPNSFVIKTNHASRTNILVEDKRMINKDEIEEKLKLWLKINFYKQLPEGGANQGREWQYRDIKPVIIIEELMKDDEGRIPNDYRFHCFRNHSDLEVIIQLDLDRFSDHRRVYYDESWNKLPFSSAFEQSEKDIEKPIALEKMIDIAKCLSKDFDYVRVDLYTVKDFVFFGELTFTPGNGFRKFNPPEFDVIIGEKWRLAN
jgi:hypothetical protein